MTDDFFVNDNKNAMLTLGRTTHFIPIALLIPNASIQISFFHFIYFFYERSLPENELESQR